jgi:hypothetical protein
MRILFILIVVFGIFAVLLLSNRNANAPATTDVPINTATTTENDNAGKTMTVYRSDEYGFTFKYPSVDYVLSEPAAGSGGPLKIIVLATAEDAAEMESGNQGGEFPPTITIRIFSNDQKEQPDNWVLNHPRFSNIELKMGETIETKVGGAEAVRYRADGLYASDVVVVTHGSYTYVFDGSYIDENSDIRKDFIALIDSIQFLP